MRNLKLGSIDYEPIAIGESTNVAGVWIHEPSSSMVFLFKKGNPYLVEGVPVHVSDQFRLEGQKIDGSMGKLYHSLIRGNPNVFRPRELEDYEFVVIG